MLLLNTLNIISEGKTQPCIELNHLVEKTYSLAKSYVYLIHKKIYKILQSGEYTINEIAIDAIASLFIIDNETNRISLGNSFKNWEPPIQSEEEALYFLNKLVSSRVEQHICSLLREYDPFFSKILDSVNYLIKMSGYKKITIVGRTCIIENSDFFNYGNIIDGDYFNKIPTNLLTDNRFLLENVFSYLKNETNFSAVIPLNLLINKLKHINFSNYLYDFNDSIHTNDFEINELIKSGYDSAKEKLELSYLRKGKLTKSETDNIDLALQDILNDLRNGGVNPGLYEYLKVYMKGLDKEFYFTKYHNILEYLVKIMKSTIAEKLKQEM